MTVFKKCTLVLCFAVIGVFFAPKAEADAFNKPTKVTFNTPVEVPGAVLPPGTYWFTVLPETHGNVVQIWNADRTKLITTALAIPDYRLNPPEEPVVLFDKDPSTGIAAVKEWFYPDEQFGRVFVYPKDKATELAKRTNQLVLSMPNGTASDKAALQSVVVVAINPSGQQVDKEQAVQSQPPK